MSRQSFAPPQSKSFGRLADGRAVALVLARGAFVEDCARAAIVAVPTAAASLTTRPHPSRTDAISR